MYDTIVQADCLPWVLVALLVGFTGRRGIYYVKGILEALSMVPPSDDRGSDEDSVEFDHAGEAYEPAELSVTVHGPLSPILEGEELRVPVVVENVGGSSGTDEVCLTVEGRMVCSDSVTLSPGERRSVTLTYPTSAGEAGEYVGTVSTDDDSAVVPVTIESVGEE